jgi:Arc/MetJ-type ribon-helix-helix transcriptional regulator
MTQQQEPGRSSKARFFEGIESMVDEAVGAATEGIRETMNRVRFSRDNVVMVRLNDESLARLDELVESGFATSRSEAAAFLIAEGVKARQPLFDQIAEKISEIRAKKEELRRLWETEAGPVNSGEAAQDVADGVDASRA